jgi:hypothetical protein
LSAGRQDHSGGGALAALPDRQACHLHAGSTDSHAHPDACAVVHPHADCRGKRHADTWYVYTHAYADCRGKRYAGNGHTHTHAHTWPVHTGHAVFNTRDALTYRHPDPRTQQYVVAHRHPDPRTQQYAVAHRHPDPRTQQYAAAHPHPDPRTQQYAVALQHTKTDSGTDPETNQHTPADGHPSTLAICLLFAPFFIQGRKKKGKKT